LNNLDDQPSIFLDTESDRRLIIEIVQSFLLLLI